MSIDEAVQTNHGDRSSRDRPLPRLPAFGAEYDGVTFGQLLDRIASATRSGRRFMVGYMNLHGAHVFAKDPEFAAFAEAADLIYADGMPLVLWRKILWRDSGRQHRFTLSQRLPSLLDFASQNRFKVFYLGASANVLEAGLADLRAVCPQLEIEGRNGFFDHRPESAECAAVIEQINAYGPDILMVGLGMPLQERWIMANRDRLNCPVIYATGAAIEYFSGHVARPPAWVSENGAEWLFRLVHQPGRLWRRYLLEPFCLLPSIASDVRMRWRRAR